MAKAFVLVGWDDVPHLTEEAKEAVLSGIPPWQIDARRKGVPSLGEGSIYPVPEVDVLCDPFPIPEHWPRVYGMDPGWNRTAAIFLAWDVDRGGIVAYDEYYKGQADPAVHVAALHAKGADWMTGTMDPAAWKARGLSGELLIDVYAELGLKLVKADNTVEPGLLKTYHLLSTGQLKIFRTLMNTRNEMRLYRRAKKKGSDKVEIVKENDHLMDALRYGVMSGRPVAKIKPFTEANGGRPWFAWNPPEVWSG
jgi:terminase large subunit-like protein